MKNWKGFFSGAFTALLLVALTGTALATTGKITKELEYRNIKVTLDGQQLDLRDAQGSPVEPFMFDGTNYLPVRALAEALGLEVAWDGTTNTVVLTTPQDAETMVTDELLFSKEHVRFYFVGYRANSDGSYEFDFRIENDSDYTFNIRDQDFAVNGQNVNADFYYTVEPGAEDVCTATVSADALADAEITEVRRISTMFDLMEDDNEGPWVRFNTGVAKINLQ